jgi:hypothetical protein
MCFSYVFDELCCFYAAAMLLVLLCNYFNGLMQDKNPQKLFKGECYVGNSLMQKYNARVGNIVINNFM